MADDLTPEQHHEQTSKDVSTVLEHLRHNRTTQREANDLQEAARRSIADHATSRSFGRSL